MAVVLSKTAAATEGKTAATEEMRAQTIMVKGKRAATTTVSYAHYWQECGCLAEFHYFFKHHQEHFLGYSAWIDWTEYVLLHGIDPENAPSALINQMTKEEPNHCCHTL